MMAIHRRTSIYVLQYRLQHRPPPFPYTTLFRSAFRLDQPDAEARLRGARDLLVLVDRLPAIDASRGRLAEAVASAFNEGEDRKSTRLNSSHPSILYGVFCLNKKKSRD